ncbi:uncharacterized protein Dwil_GK11230 [Drosophila willistoni]|uniref:Protein aurora borealis n=1 Tax=Drosophila willistoni TaxID=7260 RepID=B4N442_DROWI|nr:protein aurora borealis [Drosophila willistoni]EDW78916.1 uncharacterized protein Dwil_GK11230 [Drosophila willistoni]
MYSDEVRTPQALKSRCFVNLTQLKARVRKSSGSASNTATPTNGGNHKSPQMSSSSTTALVCTPPPKRLQKVRNPFETALAERLHLPLIASPSLFRSRTPQLSSTQFEWNIDEVSQLKPADVEPHETQFHDSPDAEQESKAQLAISAFFKESYIVPSPVDCPLRKHRIILEDNTPISNKSNSNATRRRRDCESQTILSLPPVLPKALEEALKPYFQPHLAGGIKKDRSSDPFNSSMRRKLFDMHNVVVLECEQEPPPPPQMVGSSPQIKQKTLFAGRLSDSTSGEGESSIFGCLSPIRNSCGLPPGTPDNGIGISKRKLNLPELELPSPIAPSEHLSRRLIYSKVLEVNEMSVEEQHQQNETLSEHKFTPDRSSSPMMQSLEHSDCSIYQRVRRLRVNSSKQLSDKEIHLFDENEEELQETTTNDIEEAEEEEEDEEAEAMELSQLSFNCSSSNSDTPRGHRRRRSANRKNLSQSFSTQLEQEDQEDVEEEVIQQNKDDIASTSASVALAPQPRVTFYRTDSGFNEISSSCLSQELPLDVSMAVCCSTPSTRS